MPSTSSKEVAKVFNEYQTERYPAVMESYNNSQLMSKMYEKGFIGALIFFIFAHMPFWLWRFVLSGTVRNRPQVGFLEPIPLMGTVVPHVSPSAEKARAVYGKQKQAVASA